MRFRAMGTAALRCVCAALTAFAALHAGIALGQNAPAPASSSQPRVAANDWPQYPGPNQTASSTESGWIASWPDTPPPTLWESEVGAGSSSFIVIGNRLYTQGCFLLPAGLQKPAAAAAPTTSTAKASSQYREQLMCLDTDTGVVLWRQTIREPVTIGGGRASQATPAFNEGRIYGHGMEADLICCNAETGEVVWRADLKASLGVPFIRDGHPCSPSIYGDTLLILDPLPREPPANSPWKKAWAAVFAFDKKDGKKLWQVTYEASGQSYGTWCAPVVADIDNRKTVVVSLNDHLAGIDFVTGEKLWDINYIESVPGVKEVKGGNQYPTPCLYYMGNSRFVDRMWSSTGNGTGGIDRTFCFDIKNGKLVPVWVNTEFAAMLNGFCPANGFLYGVDGRHRTMNDQRHVEDAPMLQCLDLATGVRKWGTDEFLPETFDDQPTHRAEGLLTLPPLFLLVDGKMIVWNGQFISITEVSPAGFKRVAAFPVVRAKKSTNWSMPVFSHGRLYLRPHSVLGETQYYGPSLVCYDFRTVRSAVATPDFRGATVRFNKPLDKGSAEKTANYQLDHGAKVEKATLDAGRMSVTLATSKLQANALYTLAVSGVCELTSVAAALPATALPPASVRFGALALVPGLTGEYFGEPGLIGKIERKTDKQINFPQGFKPGAGNSSVRWTGKIKPKVSDTYMFSVDDKTPQRVWVDGKLAIGRYEAQRPYSSPVALQAGQFYDIRMELFSGGAQNTTLSWSSPTTPKEVVPADCLFTVPPTQKEK